MANTQVQFGFKHIGYLGGGAPDYQLSASGLLIQSTNATKIFSGDPVQKANATSPYIVQGAGGTATTGTAIIQGVFQQVQYTPSSGVALPQWSLYWPGSANADANPYLINAPNALFLAATLLTALVTGDIGKCIGFSIGSGSTVNGISGATLDQSTATSVTSTLPFKVVQLYQGIGNGSDPSTNYNWAIVTFNNQIYRTLSGGV